VGDAPSRRMVGKLHRHARADPGGSANARGGRVAVLPAFSQATAGRRGSVQMEGQAGTRTMVLLPFEVKAVDATGIMETTRRPSGDPWWSGWLRLSPQKVEPAWDIEGDDACAVPLPGIHRMLGVSSATYWRYWHRELVELGFVFRPPWGRKGPWLAFPYQIARAMERGWIGPAK